MPVSKSEAKTHAPTKRFIEWLRAECAWNNGKLPAFDKTIAARKMGFDEEQQRENGLFRGQIQSRIDFACYLNNFPPLGQASDEPFPWGEGREAEAVAKNFRQAARERTWTEDDFAKLKDTLAKLGPSGKTLWANEAKSCSDKIRRWEASFQVSSGVEIWPFPATLPKPTGTNPKWTRDELMLALHLYLHNRQSPPGKNSAPVAELSQLLNQMNPASGTTNYRNSAGVYMKLMNFRGIDPVYTAEGKRGLSQGSKDDQVVWDLFAHRLPHLDTAVASLKAIVAGERADSGIDEPDEPEIEDCEEGRVFTRLHRFRERNRKLVADFKARSLKHHGELRCGGCDTDFAVKYGAMAERLIDVHHTKPIHTMKPGDKTDPKDLVLLCVSCHRAVHSERQWLSVDELRRRLGKPQVV
ncbi:HNH endonuclease [Massilia varians]